MDYDAIAEAYAAGVDQRTYNALYERPAMLDLLPTIAGRDVLDAGCGNGWYAEQLLERGARVTAVDLSARMAGIARTRLGGRYTDTDPVEEVWEWCGAVRFFRRPLAGITEPLAAAGFLIERLVEPRPSAELRAADPAAFARLDVMPGFLLLRAWRG